LADRYLRERNEPQKSGAPSPEDLALERARQHPAELLKDSAVIQREFRWGSLVLGGWIGAVVGIKLIGVGLRRQRTDFEPASGECFACARCFEFCPNELVRRGVVIEAPAAAGLPDPATCSRGIACNLSKASALAAGRTSG